MWSLTICFRKPYHPHSVGHGGKRIETERKTDIEIHAYHHKRHEEEWADRRQHSRSQGLEIGSFQGDPVTRKSLLGDNMRIHYYL